MALTQSYLIWYVNNQTNIHSITYFLLSDKSAIYHNNFGLYEVRNDGIAEFSMNCPALLLWYIYHYVQYPYIQTTLMCDISFSTVSIQYMRTTLIYTQWRRQTFFSAGAMGELGVLVRVLWNEDDSLQLLYMFALWSVFGVHEKS